MSPVTHGEEVIAEAHHRRVLTVLRALGSVFLPLTFVKQATSPLKDNVFVSKRCHGTTPAQICPRSKTAGKPPRTRS